MERTEIINFEPIQYVVEGNMVVVLGQEHQKVKQSGRELKQKWVQIYRVENGLITRMEETESETILNELSSDGKLEKRNTKNGSIWKKKK